MSEEINQLLLDFSMHWTLDGDYLRCRRCRRPHIASRSDMPFSHADGCKLEIVASRHPWQLLQSILAEVPPA